MRTRLALGGPGASYGTFTAKTAVPVRLTRLGLGGPGADYRLFTAKAEADDGEAGSFDFITIARRRGRR